MPEKRRRRTPSSVPTIRIGIDPAVQVCSVLHSLPWVAADSVIEVAIGRDFQPAAAARPFLRAALENRNQELSAWQCSKFNADSSAQRLLLPVPPRVFPFHKVLEAIDQLSPVRIRHGESVIRGLPVAMRRAQGHALALSAQLTRQRGAFHSAGSPRQLESGCSSGSSWSTFDLHVKDCS
jgi:hypothetical protein